MGKILALHYSTSLSNIKCSGLHHKGGTNEVQNVRDLGIKDKRVH